MLSAYEALAVQYFIGQIDMNLLWFSLGLSLVLLSPRLIECEVYYITPSSSDPCHEETNCLTLSQFAANAIDFLDSNATACTLQLLPGNHSLDTNLAITYLESFEMISNFTTAEPMLSSRVSLETKITCSGLSMINFNTIFHLYIGGIEFVRCGGIKIGSVNNFTLSNSYFDGQKLGRTALQLSETAASIIATYFVSNSNHLGIVSSSSNIFRGFSSQTKKFGGAIFAERSTITLFQSTFDRNSAERGGAIYCESDSIMRVINSTFVGNHAVCRSGSGRISTFTQVFNGGAIAAYNSRINSSHTQFNSNRACKDGGALLAWQSVVISNCDHFGNNSAGSNGGAMSAYKSTAHYNGNHFENNRADKKGGVVSMDRSTLSTIRSYFYNNSARTRGGVMLASGSTMNSNESHFSSNRALHGGVISVEDTNNGSTINSKYDHFIDNSATFYGGVLHLTNLAKKRHASIKCYSDRFVGNSAGWYGGVMWAEKSVMYSNNNIFTNNSAGLDAGVMLIATNSTVEYNDDRINDNRARHGGALVAKNSTVSSKSCSFINNSASVDAGVMMLTEGSTAESNNNHFQDNRAGRDGGVVLTEESRITSTSDIFSGNRAGRDGGVFHNTNGAPFQANSIEGSVFTYNRANHHGGVVYSYRGNITANMVTIWGNSADKDGGVFKMIQGSLQVSNGNISNSSADYGGVICANQLALSLNSSNFSENVARVGGAFYVSGSIHNRFVSLTLAYNKAISAFVYLMDSGAHFSGNSIFLENVGSLLVIMSNVTFLNSVAFTNNSYCEISDPGQVVPIKLLGGAITAFHSQVVFHGECHLNYNRAKIGGAIRSMKSRIDAHGNLTFADNFAAESGGGVYLYQSELACHHYGTLRFLGNTAGTDGGGVYAFSSNINLRSDKSLASTDLKLHFVDNLAEKGGGVYLEMNSVIYIHKSAPSREPYPILNFTTNFADYGGAIFNADNTNFGTCTYFENRTHTMPHECSIQILSLYGSNLNSSNDTSEHVYFTGNNATSSGPSLYGGSLGMCTVSSMADEGSIIAMEDEHENTGLMYLETISDIQRWDIGSPPAKVCFCRGGHPDCDLQAYRTMQVERGETITVPLVVLDEAGNPVKGAAVHGSLSSNNSGLCRHQRDKQSTLLHAKCSEFTFRAFSIRPSDDLVLQVESIPCQHMVSPQIQVPLQFPWCDNCPIGFQRFEDQELGCRCDCHPDVMHHFSDCNSKTQMLQKGSSAWIAYINNSNNSRGFIIHPYCPLDYCRPTDSPVYINFNKENGSNAQCAHNRSGMLCGSCPSELSLSLGSSRCLTCPKLWPLQTLGIILFALLAGLALVAVILAINLTVAVGTLNGIIFYVNIVAANRMTFLPFTQPNFVTLFINWLNMEIGIDVCFFKGMDAYWKTWLQLAFPTYVIFLVVVIIVISECSTRFAHLIGRKNPMATLTTLILLSYTKFLHTIVAAFSFATIRYPDGSSQTVWLPDATVSYLRGRHIVLFLAALSIVVLSVVYTALLFCWQWLLHYQQKAAFGWVKNQKLYHFLEPYHAPYTFKHRYWTGLLLLVRVVLYVISATNVSGDPRVNLVSTISLVTFLLLLKGLLGVRLYKKVFVDIMEVLMCFNLLMFSALSWYTLETHSGSSGQAAIAYTSVSVTIVLLITVLVYHVYEYTGVIKKFRRSLHFKKLFTELRRLNKDGPEQSTGQSKRDNDLDFCQVIDERAKSTYTVVEVCKSHQPCKPKLQDQEKCEDLQISNPESRKCHKITVDLENGPGENNVPDAAVLQSVEFFNQDQQGKQLNESKVEVSASSETVSDSSDAYECSDTPLSADMHMDSSVKIGPTQTDIVGDSDVKVVRSMTNDSDKSTATPNTAIIEDTNLETAAAAQPSMDNELNYCGNSLHTAEDGTGEDEMDQNLTSTTTLSCTTLPCVAYRQTE